MYKAIDEEVCSVQLANRQPGKLVHARWLTAGNRMLRLYVSTENPSKELEILRKLVSYILTVYVPIRPNRHCLCGLI